MRLLSISLLLLMLAIFFPLAVQAKPPQEKELIQSLQQAEALITALAVEYSEEIFLNLDETPERQKNKRKIIAEINGRAKCEEQSELFKVTADGEKVNRHVVASGFFDGSTCFTVRGQSGRIDSHSYNLPWGGHPKNLATCFNDNPVSKILSERGIEFIKAVTRNGQTMLLVETKTAHHKEEWRYRFLIDPKRNYVVVKKSQLIRFPPNNRWIEHDFIIGVNHKEIKTGVWLPSQLFTVSYKVTREIAEADQEFSPFMKRKIIIKSWEVNPKIDDTTFTFKFPPDIPVEDHRKKTVPLSDLSE